jgi:hypothetical protein
LRWSLSVGFSRSSGIFFKPQKSIILNGFSADSNKPIKTHCPSSFQQIRTTSLNIYICFIVYCCLFYHGIRLYSVVFGGNPFQLKSIDPARVRNLLKTTRGTGVEERLEPDCHDMVALENAVDEVLLDGAVVVPEKTDASEGEETVVEGTDVVVCEADEEVVHYRNTILLPANSVLFSERFLRIVTLLKELFCVQAFCVFCVYFLFLYTMAPEDDWQNFFAHGFIIIPYLPELVLVKHSWRIQRSALMAVWAIGYTFWNWLGASLVSMSLYPPLLPWVDTTIVR